MRHLPPEKFNNGWSNNNLIYKGNSMKTVNEMVQELVQKGFSQKHIAEQIGLSQPVVSELFTGKQTDMFYMKGGKRLEIFYMQTMKG